MYSTDVCAVCYWAMENISPHPFSLCFQIYSAPSSGFGFVFFSIFFFSPFKTLLQLWLVYHSWLKPIASSSHLCARNIHPLTQLFISKRTQTRFICKTWPLYGQFLHFSQHVNFGRKGRTFGKPWSGYTGIRAGKTQTPFIVRADPSPFWSPALVCSEFYALIPW